LTSFLIYAIFVAASFGILSSLLFDLIRAVGATERVYTIIHRKEEINVYKGGKIIPDDKLKGDLEFKNVNFYYNSRKDNVVLDNLNLKIKSGNVVALVGKSGGIIIITHKRWKINNCILIVQTL
jgi:ABC-type multidrug transport system fused ATPase/permease subunit